MNVFQGEYFEFLTVYLVYFFFNLSLRDFAVLSSASWDRFSFMFPGNLTHNENWPSVDLLFYAALARQPTFNDKINIVRRARGQISELQDAFLSGSFSNPLEFKGYHPT